MSLLGLFKGGGSVDIKQFWLHSLCVASTSELAPRYLGRMAQNSESLFTAGLLHDVGILVMELFTGDLYRSVVTMSVDTNQPLLQTEKKLMQIDHAEVGGLVLAKWGIPEVIADAAARHHTPFKPSEGALPLSDAIQFANLICNDNGIANGTGTVLAKITEAEWSEFSFQTANLPSLKEEIQKVVVRCSSMLAAS
jgi:putative nucleotidyltransferase with HDIG domain